MPPAPPGLGVESPSDPGEPPLRMLGSSDARENNQQRTWYENVKANLWNQWGFFFAEAQNASHGLPKKKMRVQKGSRQRRAYFQREMIPYRRLLHWGCFFFQFSDDSWPDRNSHLCIFNRKMFGHHWSPIFVDLCQYFFKFSHAKKTLNRYECEYFPGALGKGIDFEQIGVDLWCSSLAGAGNSGKHNQTPPFPESNPPLPSWTLQRCPPQPRPQPQGWQQNVQKQYCTTWVSSVSSILSPNLIMRWIRSA